MSITTNAAAYYSAVILAEAIIKIAEFCNRTGENAVDATASLLSEDIQYPVYLLLHNNWNDIVKWANEIIAKNK